MNKSTSKELPRRWMAPVSQDLWGRDSGARPYKTVPLEVLPKLELGRHHPSADPFAWLRVAPSRPHADQLKLGLEGEGLRHPIEDIVAAAKRERLTIPPTYITFMTDASLHERIPTCTACYLDVPKRLVALPDGQPGKLLRFMNDQQCAVLWYLHLKPNPNGECSVVCAEPTPIDDDEALLSDDSESDDDLDTHVKPADLAMCSPTFDEFIHRFWMENTLWFALYKKTSTTYSPLTSEQQSYLAAIKKARPTKAN